MSLGAFTSRRSHLRLPEALNRLKELDIHFVKPGTGSYPEGPHCKLSTHECSDEFHSFCKTLDDRWGFHFPSTLKGYLVLFGKSFSCGVPDRSLYTDERNRVECSAHAAPDTAMNGGTNLFWRPSRWIRRLDLLRIRYWSYAPEERQYQTALFLQPIIVRKEPKNAGWACGVSWRSYPGKLLKRDLKTC